MPRTARHALIATLIALHAAVAVCGAGLHGLPGWGHDSGLHRRSQNDHSHGPGKTSHEAADECAVCQFLAQGQLSCDFPCGLSSPLTVGLETPPPPPADPFPVRSPSFPRGPPAPRPV